MARDRAARPEAKPLRLFVAIEIPDAVKDTVEEAFAPWREAFPKARWVPRENMHVTLKFLGRTWPRLVDWVPERIGEAAAEFEPFETRLLGVGSFPSAKRGRAIWAGFDDEEGRLTALAGAFDEALEDEFDAEKRPFHPHLTVARSDPPLKLPAAYTSTELVSEPWAVEHVTLFRSHLGRPAPRYEPLDHFPLCD
jgi:RNA 2',3'-cyclic 3'-phosphodiesterase